MDGKEISVGAERPVSGPTIYSVVMSERSLDLAMLVSKQIIGPEHIRFRDKLNERVTGAIREAYVRGVCDGFAQGVAAATAPTVPPATTTGDSAVSKDNS